MAHLDHALHYAALGIPVMPLFEPRPDGSCSCARNPCAYPGKHPRNRHGLNAATTDPETIHRWWTTWPTANIGGRTGIVFDVCDIDSADGITAVRPLLGADHRTMPLVRTGSGGWHLIFAPTGHGNRVKFLPGVDWRGAGGYVVLPPSRHASGQPYRFARQPAGALPEAPPGLLRALSPPTPDRPSTARRGSVVRPRGYAQAALAREAENVATARPGTRNDTLNRAAYNLGQLIAAGQLTEDDVTTELTAAALRAELAPGETQRTITSGLAAGQRQPRTARTA
jgi:Bifunctional DNA primase/polymerase, N-terminal